MHCLEIGVCISYGGKTRTLHTASSRFGSEFDASTSLIITTTQAIELKPTLGLDTARTVTQGAMTAPWSMSDLGSDEAPTTTLTTTNQRFHDISKRYFVNPAPFSKPIAVLGL